MTLFNYECDEIKRKIQEVSPNYPQLTTYTSEWLYFYENEYTPGTPVELEYKTVNVNPSGSVANAIPHQYKSAILKGNTLVNVGTYKTKDDFFAYDGTIDNDSYLTITAINGSYKNAFTKTNSMIKPSTKYLIVFDIVENTLDTPFAAITLNNNLPSDSVWTTDGDASIPIGAKGVYKFIRTTKSDLSKSTIQTILRSYVDEHNTTGTYIKYRTMIIEYQEGMENWDIPFFTGMQSVQMPVLTTSNGDGTKTNILTVNEEVELRGIGDVKDELNLLTGELTQRIGEIVLNGSENYSVHKTGDEFMRFKLVMEYSDVKRWGKSISNNFAYNRQILGSSNDLEICNGDNAREAFLFNIHKSRLSTNDVNGFKDWLSQNNTIIHYELSNNTVKTVDLTPLNKPYEGTNHYQLTSNVPCEVILEVPVVSTGEQTLEEINH